MPSKARLSSDKFHNGRPSTAVNQQNIDAVCRKIETGRPETFREMQVSLFQVYCYDSKIMQQSTVWAYRDEPKPAKVVREQSASKQMIDSFLIKLDAWLLLF
ncbi:hypothetical protein EVAR_39010_1 [Eumeta japonica]|uniref:Uncharacterized protein n=1 Tax=Eumeta variegata TaxID=151549 RepID=A0A4C1WRU4_EUMVA|nr:hypothetical protein EVAR_39010_1 [Eumeta japonica]